MFFLEPELQAAQHEVEQLRLEVEKLKKYGENNFFMCILEAVFKELFSAYSVLKGEMICVTIPTRLKFICFVYVIIQRKCCR